MFKKIREPFKQDAIVNYNWHVDNILKDSHPYAKEVHGADDDDAKQRRTAIRIYPEDIPELHIADKPQSTIYRP